MSFNYFTIEGIGVTESNIAPFVNPKKVIECIKKLCPSELEDIENDTNGVDDIDELENIVDGYICSGGYYKSICEMLVYMNDENFLLFEPSNDEDYLFYPRKYPWEMKKGEPKTLQEVHEIIIDAVLLVCDMTREQVENLIDDDIFETYYG